MLILFTTCTGYCSTFKVRTCILRVPAVHVHMYLIRWITTTSLLVTCACRCHGIIYYSTVYIGSPKKTQMPLLYPRVPSWSAALGGTRNHVNPDLPHFHFHFHFRFHFCYPGTCTPLVNVGLLLAVERYSSISIHLLQWHACQCQCQ